MAASFKGKAFTAHLAFSGETELIDRVEYAMRFLKMSCDDSAATGFWGPARHRRRVAPCTSTS
ncbi:hypothetical protein [Roseateles asaccharophilus]|uniref:Uncharacterized protein n=1 Tax=Roseateles asaccharophilus TaxID=582607 RepID=A0ABU2A5A4_9BURK|nr:hypothetical protein [Roseateles asaccharophilus]MDR7332377.1 hypothetical protein [Roseateles asaccharophilus]